MQATYNTVNVNTKELEPTLVAVENLLSFDGLKFIISNASKNFLSFGPLGMLLLSLIGITIGEGTGFFETLTRRHISKISKILITTLLFKMLFKDNFPRILIPTFIIYIIFLK